MLGDQNVDDISFPSTRRAGEITTFTNSKMERSGLAWFKLSTYPVKMREGGKRERGPFTPFHTMFQDSLFAERNLNLSFFQLPDKRAEFCHHLHHVRRKEDQVAFGPGLVFRRRLQAKKGQADSKPKSRGHKTDKQAGNLTSLRWKTTKPSSCGLREMPSSSEIWNLVCSAYLVSSTQT